MPCGRRPPSVLAAALLAVVLAILLGGCFTGERPSFADDQFGSGRPTGDPAIDAVLAKFDSVAAQPPTFTAAYDITVRFGNLHKSATVTVDGRDRTVTMDGVHYLQTPELIETCRDAICTTGLDPAAISDSQLTIDFYAADAAKRLRLDATAKIGPTASRTEQIAGQTATCVDVIQSTGTATYCVLDDGALAKLTDGDVYVTMTSFGATADPAAFASPTSGPPTTT
jgi:hypothetical protein